MYDTRTQPCVGPLEPSPFMYLLPDPTPPTGPTPGGHVRRTVVYIEILGSWDHIGVSTGVLGFPSPGTRTGEGPSGRSRREGHWK